MDVINNIFSKDSDMIIKTEDGFEWGTTKVKPIDIIQNLYTGFLFGLFFFTFILLVFYFVSLLRFRRPKCNDT